MFTFLIRSISPAENPLAFLTDIVTSLAPIEPVSVVELATHNCPPTAFTDSFSKVVVLNVPLILIFSNSAVPFPSDEIFHPCNPLAKSLVCKIPSGFIIRLPPSIDEVVISHPPIDADTNLAKPSDLMAALAVRILVPAGANILLTDKSALIWASAPITNKLASGSKWNIDELISMLPSEPLINCVFSVPIKNLSVLTSNNPPLSVVNIKFLLSLSPTNWTPTPSKLSSPNFRLPEPLYIINPPGDFPNDAEVNPSNPTERINPLLAPPISIPVPNVLDIKIEPLIKFSEPPM